MIEKIHHTFTIPEECDGMRFDQAVAKLLPEYSRTQIQEWIKKGEITLENTVPKNKIVVRSGQCVQMNANLKSQPAWLAQNISLDVIDENESFIVINKPIGMVVHPGAGNNENTLLNALLYYAPQLKLLPRAGIIHRLDKNTSGIMVIAKTPVALTHLTRQLKARKITRIYQAIVTGVMTSGGTIDEPIARHPLQRKKMAVIDTGRKAITHFRIIERYRHHTRVKVELETGRTHQIRVHMAHIHFPILGDPLYGGRLKLPKAASPALIQILRDFKHQALHANELRFLHPLTLKEMNYSAPLPDDMQQLIEILKKD